MDRRAVAATIASAVIFSTMLLANAAVYATQNSYVGAADRSSAQLQERGYATVLLGVAAYSSLEGAQHLLQSRPMDCLQPQSYLSSIQGQGNLEGSNRSVRYALESSWGYSNSLAGLPGDRLLPPQFTGPSAGALDVRVTVDLNETYLGGLPSYTLEQSEVVHLPVDVGLAASQCQYALSELRASLSEVPSCDSSSVDTALGAARASSPLLGSYLFGASATPGVGQCSVDYWVTRTQTGLQGVAGTFQWTVQGSGTLLLSAGVPPVTPPSST